MLQLVVTQLSKPQIYGSQYHNAVAYGCALESILLWLRQSPQWEMITAVMRVSG